MKNIILIILCFFCVKGFTQEFNPNSKPNTYRSVDNPHYWKNKPSFSKHSVAWNNFIKDAEDILLVTESLQLVRAEFDQLDMIPEVGENRIKFNGIGEDGHETFIINREDDEDFEFCKTARKPYDKIVTAILALAKHHLVIPNISSDGTSNDWDEGVDYASKILNKNI